MYLPAFALLHRQHGLITHRQLRDLGLGPSNVRRLVRAGDLVRLRRGVYVDGEVWRAADPFRGQPVLHMRGARLALRSTYVFSHDSAAIVQAMGAPDATTPLVHVTRRKVHGDAVRAGVKHHLAPYPRDAVVVVDGLEVLEPARTALDMVREHGRVAGLAACDAALRLGSTREQLHAVLATMHCWPRSTTMRWCVESADGGAESYLESQGRDLVLELGLGVPDTQFGLSDGRREVWIDIRLRRHLFEVDGMQKYEAEDLDKARAVLRAEKERQDFITGFKLGVSRITAYDCGPGRRQALERLAREVADTDRRFGTSIDDLAPFILPKSLRRRAG